MCSRFQKVRTSSPAAVIRSSDSATCTITSPFPNTLRRGPPKPAEPVLSASPGSTSVEPSAGASPSRIPVMTESPAVNATTLKSSLRSTAMENSRGSAELPHSASRSPIRAGSANRKPNGDFLPPRRRPRQKKIGKIGADDQQRHPYHRHQHPQWRRESRPQHVKPLSAGLQIETALQKQPAFPFAMLELHRPLQVLLKDDVQDGGDALRRLPVGDSRHRAQPANIHLRRPWLAAIRVARRRAVPRIAELRLHHQGHPHIRFFAQREPEKIGFGHAHNRERRAIDGHSASHCARIAVVPALPIPVAQERRINKITDVGRYQS